MRALIADSPLPDSNWGYALHHATTLQNWSPKASNPDHHSPYVTLFKRQPPWELLHKFGATVFSHIPANRLTDKHVKPHTVKGFSQVRYHAQCWQSSRLRVGASRLRALGVERSVHGVGCSGFGHLDVRVELPCRTK
eukprot:CAMPEP_0184326982 /NCGR_PEP_ID=MMETSP1049-20130417/142853_1 /TAXON_ID=77928 /ORGANISM="Proteomonas sulcata, Strain CCMP704" /LENGTH=136 /DNA_ID=CAMNT_0026649213 /DNA_START=135 /DNA_END=545 /DNA_ORIENTATION=+